MQRSQKSKILNDLKKKLVFIVGPRQVGKTWLSKEIMKEYKTPLYFSYDSIKDRNIIKNESWGEDTDLIVLDEIHKMRDWKNYLKGVYDTKNSNLHILVTGSARLDVFKNAGDSMAGRYRTHHLLPIDYKEVFYSKLEKKININKLMERGGFPEPLLSVSENDRRVWRNLYNDSLIKEDVLSIKSIENINAIRHVFDLLRYKVGSPISYKSIAEDIGISPVTVKSYIAILEALYVIFIIKPYSKKIKRSILKEPKVYFYDNGLVIGEEGIQFENMLAISLQKYAHNTSDETGIKTKIYTLRNKQRNEIDFLIVKDDLPYLAIEAKLSDDKYSDNLKYFKDNYNIDGVQVVKNLKHNSTIKGYGKVEKAEDFLKSL